MTTPDRRIEAIAERLAKATPGEWERQATHIYAPGPTGANVCSIGEPRASKYVGYTPLELGSEDGEEAWANADFIAHAPADIAWLLSEVTRLESSLTQARELMEEAADAVHDGALEPRSNGWVCSDCGASSSASAWDPVVQHTPDCLVTKLREAAKQEDRADV